MALQQLKETASHQEFPNIHCKRSRREITGEDEFSVVFTSTLDRNFMAMKENEYSTEPTTGSAIRYGGLFRSVSFPLPVWDKGLKMSIGKGTTSEAASNTGGDVNTTLSATCSSLRVHILDCEKQQTKGMQTEEVGSVIVAEEAIAFSPPGISEGDSSKIVSDGNGLTEERCPAYGSISVIGRRREMEDTVSVVPDFVSSSCVATDECHDRQPFSSLHFFGVYDGHGGSQVSSICKERLHCVLAEEVSRLSLVEDNSRNSMNDWKSEWEAAVKACFLRMDEQVGGICPNGSCSYLSDFSNCSCDTISPGTVGSTAVVAVVGANQIVVGNCGDSRAVISRSGKAIAVSRDHKPEREDERKRIETAGGHIVNWCGYRVGGLLAMSRAIGDRCLKPFVIAEPEVTCLERTEEDEFLILASDGLWDVVSNDLACEVVQKSLSKKRKKQSSGCASAADVNVPTTKAASTLARLAYARGSTDNITVVIVDLKTRHR